jgi:hypothetical protein
MLRLEYEMTYAETIEGPLPPTTGSPFGERLCWQIKTAELTGPRIDARLAMPGYDWLSLGPDGIRRPDLRAALVTASGETILFHYDTGLIRSTPRFLAALAAGEPTDWDDQYMRMVPEFEVGPGDHGWLTEHLFVAKGRLAGVKRLEYAIYRVL